VVVGVAAEARPVLKVLAQHGRGDAGAALVVFVVIVVVVCVVVGARGIGGAWVSGVVVGRLGGAHVAQGRVRRGGGDGGGERVAGKEGRGRRRALDIGRRGRGAASVAGVESRQDHARIGEGGRARSAAAFGSWRHVVASGVRGYAGTPKPQCMVGTERGWTQLLSWGAGQGVGWGSALFLMLGLGLSALSWSRCRSQSVR
jgi:hypothetical protein